MANERTRRIEGIFHQALQKGTEQERSAYLDSVCGDDTGLRAAIEGLLKAHDKAGGFLDSPVFETSVTLNNSPLSEGPGTIIGPYRLLERIGEGGMAVVYMAEQEKPIRRKVALKIIKVGMDTKQVIARFEAERQALALMEHPNIAKVLDAGATEGGRPYFVMELVRGSSITAYCDENKLCTKDRLSVFIQVCNAVQHAHQKGIIHRDIKPSNIMVTQRDGTPIPKVIDFGIAKATNQRLTEKTLFTRFAQIIGTPQYMSPEQAEFGELDIDTRSDIYSLGILLYELLTGTTPLDAGKLLKAGYLAMQRIICEEAPVKPSTKLSKLIDLGDDTLADIAKQRGSTPELLAKTVRGDLDWIVMKALAKERTCRYETASELAMDLEHHLHNEPILARPPSRLYRFGKLVRRNRAVFAAVGAVAAVLMLGVIVIAQQVIHLKTRELVMRHAYASDISLAQQTLAMNDSGRARRLLDAHRPEPGEIDLRGWEWRYMWPEHESDALGELYRYPPSAYSVAYSPDGSVLAVGGSVQEFIDVWDVAGGKRIKNLQSEQGSLAAFSPNGDLLATDAGSEIRLWRTDSWEPAMSPLRLGKGSIALVLKFSPDGSHLACMHYSESVHEVTVWETGQWSVSRPIDGVRFKSFCGTLDFSPNSEALVIGDNNHRLQVVDLASRNIDVNIPEAHSEGLSAVAWSPDGSLIASGSAYSGGSIRLWDAASGRRLGELPGHTSWICELVFSKDGLLLYSAGGDQTIRIWNVEQRLLVATLRGSSHEVYGLALSPDGNTLASACKDGVVAFWPALPASEEETPRLIELDTPSWPAFAPDGRVLAAPSAGTVRLFDLVTFEETAQIDALGTDVWLVAYSPDGSLLVSGSLSGKVRVWSCTGRKLLEELDGHTGPIIGLYFRSDGKRLLSVDQAGNAIWWEASTWEHVKSFTLKLTGWVAVSPNGRLLAMGAPGELRWFNAQTGALLETTPGPADTMAQVTFSGDGSRLAGVSQYGTVAMWDPSSFQTIKDFQGHMQGAHGVAFSADGRTLATGGGTNRDAVKLWNVATQRELMTLSGEGSEFRIVIFSPDGRWLAARSSEGKFHLWHAPTWAEIEAAEKGITTELPR
ncbi:MAG: serine/threonine protein kinase [Phycisphaerae bacterium]|nr:serine/threonine protein kinase [Phycisphaerae bacterium]